jgi:hypothetical protein
LHGHTNIVALGITTEIDQLALALGDGSKETPPSPARCAQTC